MGKNVARKMSPPYTKTHATRHLNPSYDSRKIKECSLSQKAWHSNGLPSNQKETCLALKLLQFHLGTS